MVFREAIIVALLGVIGWMSLQDKPEAVVRTEPCVRAEPTPCVCPVVQQGERASENVVKPKEEKKETKSAGNHFKKEGEGPSRAETLLGTDIVMGLKHGGHTKEDMLRLADMWRMRADNEVRRVAAAATVPKSVPTYTANGFAKYKFHPDAYKMIKDWYMANKHMEEIEKWHDSNSFTNHYEVATTMQHIPQELKDRVIPYIRSQISQWSNVSADDLEFTSLYGIRYYHRGSVLRMHQDRDDQLVLSMIVNVDQDVDEDWPLEIIGHDGKTHKVIMEPGDIVYYESIACVHGRPEPFQGRFFANFFAHTRPKGWLNIVKEFREKNNIPDPREGISKRSMATATPKPLTNPGGKQIVARDASSTSKMFDPDWTERTALVHHQPKVHSLRHFLSDAESTLVIDTCKDKFVNDKCELPSTASFVSLIERRAARVAGVQMTSLEPLQVQRLSPGAVTHSGRDWLDHPTADISNQRLHSFLVYLNDDYEGGETKGQHNQAWTTRPERGLALHWQNCAKAEDGEETLCFNQVSYEDTAPKSGTKYVLLVRSRFEDIRRGTQVPWNGVATRSFEPTRSTEVGVSPGDRVTVYRYAPLGWIDVLNHATGKQGWAPGSAIKEDEEEVK